MPTLEETLIDRSGRWNTIPSLKPAFAAVTRALDVHMKFKAKAAEVAGDTHRTAIGKRDAMQKFTAEHSHELLRARKSVDVMKAKLSQRRAKLMPPPANPADFAAAVTRGEIRAYLRGIRIPANGSRCSWTPTSTSPSWTQRWRCPTSCPVSTGRCVN